MEAIDREEIRELTAVYASAIDGKDYAAIADCFTDDAVAQYNGFSLVLTGRDEIVTHMKKALEPLTLTQHMFANFIIEGDPATARMTCDIIAQHLKGEEACLAGGKYRLELRKSAGRWRFARLDARSAWQMGAREMLPRT